MQMRDAKNCIPKKWKHESDIAVGGMILLKFTLQEQCVPGCGLDLTAFGQDQCPAVVNKAIYLFIYLLTFTCMKCI